MAGSLVSNRIEQLIAAKLPLFRFMTQSTYAQRAGDPTICDMVLGNPHEMPLEEFSAALRHWSVPKDKDWFAYKFSEPSARAVVGASLRDRHQIPFEDDDIHMTSGAFAGLAVALRTYFNPGDGVIILFPTWFF